MQGRSISQLARELAVSQSAVFKALALLQLTDGVQEQVEQEALAPHTAYEVSRLESPEFQAEVAQAVIDHGLKRSEVAELVGALNARRPAAAERFEPLQLDLGDGMTLRLAWKKANGVVAIKALKIALKLLQELARGDQAASGQGVWHSQDRSSMTDARTPECASSHLPLEATSPWLWVR